MERGGTLPGGAQVSGDRNGEETSIIVMLRAHPCSRHAKDPFAKYPLGRRVQFPSMSAGADGASAEGEKELIAVIDGYHESKQGGMERLLDLKR